jgi:hypothetical protein
MTDHKANRRGILDALQRELVGPAPAGAEIDTSHELRFTDPQQTYGPWREVGTGEEILVRDSPTKRYGVGVLYPLKAPLEETPAGDGEESADALPEGPPETQEPDAEPAGTAGHETDTDDFDLSLANAYQPSSMGVSFLAEVPHGTSLVVEATGGRYRRVLITTAFPEKPERRRTWWVRAPVSVRVTVPSALLRAEGSARLIAKVNGGNSEGIEVEASRVERLDLRVEIVTRPHGPQQRLFTVCLVNRTTNAGSPSEGSLFQAGFTVTVAVPGGRPAILPYPGPQATDDEEEESLALLYRRAQMFATGHGCSADWNVSKGDDRAMAVRAECFPAVETPTITPDILRPDGSRLVASMPALAGLTPGDDGFGAVEEIVTRYEAWIADRREDVATLQAHYRAAAARHLSHCEEAAVRMRAGLTYLREDASALRAFRLANHAILLQQLVTRAAARTFAFDAARGVTFSEAFHLPDASRPPLGRGEWRAFQVAFLLASLRSSVEGNAPDRRTVELIWFPTGGGKTEAYLTLAAFAMFKRRLDDRADTGVQVLMRYTLRLLTSQQFERASRLLCAMEHLRKRHEDELGPASYSAGIWLGGDTTPNTRKQALHNLRELERFREATNPFVLARCPWCGAQLGRLEVPRRGGNGRPRAITPGYVRRQEPEWAEATVAFQCPDPSCEFASGLPVYVIDEDIYHFRPTLVIGTVDKFAMLAWKPQARALFGLGSDGRRTASPPGLIIQDELHLIAGPLGSMAGLYETLIEELCTDRRSGTSISPKILGSTATIRRYENQIRGLYARETVALFPPPGLDAGDSFFARYDENADGRIYVGVHAVSLGSVQTQWVRTFTALLQAPMPLDAEGRDPWWTMLVFFNSIREMGTAHTLFQSDVPDYARVVWGRAGTPREQWRRPTRIFELTGGLPSGEVTGAIAALEVPCTGRGTPKDVCMASNIIEVGIDIPRLSLMVVAGQPKTTSQYIQVTGRVGRLSERPGLIVTMYSPSKPRDRSHFERFRSYHERLYAHVEPSSVTPFSPPALDRALHAVLVAHCRQRDSQELRPFPFPASLVEQFRPLIEKRVHFVDPAEAGTAIRVFERRARQWRDWQRTRWSGDPNGEETPLLRVAGEYASPEAARLSWPTPTSMRNVDAECEAQITTRYLPDEGGDA